MSGYLQRIGYGHSRAYNIYTGNNQEDGFEVAAEIHGGADVRLELRHPDTPEKVLWLSDEVATTSTKRLDIAQGADADHECHTVKISCIGEPEIDPATRYIARLIVDDVRYPQQIIRPMTFPVEGDPASFSVVGGSCSDTGRPFLHEVFYGILKMLPLMFFHFGDWFYSNITNHLDPTEAMRKHDRFTGLLHSLSDLARWVSIARLMGNHTYGSETISLDYTNGATIMQNSRAAMMKQFPHYPFVNVALGESNPVYYLITQVINIARVRFILIDDIAQQSASANTLVGNASSHWDQLAWMKAQMTQAANDGLVMLVFCTQTMFASTNSVTPRASWGGSDFNHERAELCAFAKDIGIQIMFWAGDPHASDHSDGMNANVQYAPGTAIPIFTSSPLYNSNIANHNLITPTFKGVTREVNNNTQMFQLLEFVDVPPAAPSFTMGTYGSPYDADDDYEPTLLMEDDSDETITLEFAATDMNAEAGEPIPLLVEKDFFGPIDEMNAQGGTDTFDATSGGDTDTIGVMPNASAWGALTTTVLAPAVGATKTVTIDNPGSARIAIGAADSIIVHGREPETMELYESALANGVAPTIARMTLLDALIAGLKSDAVWTHLKLLYILKGHSAGFCHLNIHAPNTYPLTAFNSPTFAADDGYTGDGATAYLGAGYTFTAPADNINSVCAFGWCASNQQSGASIVGKDSASGGSFSVSPRNTSNQAFGRVHDASSLVQGSITDAIGLLSINRSGASARQLYKDGSLLTSDTAAATTLASGFTILKNSTLFFPGKARVAGLADSLDATKQLALYNRLNTYLSAF